jgi:hypothetical protein
MARIHGAERPRRMRMEGKEGWLIAGLVTRPQSAAKHRASLPATGLPLNQGVSGGILPLAGSTWPTDDLDRVGLRREGRLMKAWKPPLILIATIAGATACVPPPMTPQTLPNPILYMTHNEYYSANGKNWIRYSYDVLNKDVYPAEMFAAAPTLPPCGLNANSSRSWVEFFDQAGNQLYGFCALSDPAQLGQIWFAREEGEVPPSWIYIEINDRQTNSRYRSNLAETTL